MVQKHEQQFIVNADWLSSSGSISVNVHDLMKPMSLSSSSIFLKVLEEERDLSDRDTDLEDSPDLTNGTSWRKEEEEEEAPAAGGVSVGRQAMCHLLAPPLERSGRETPVSVDSIPLEWDHTVDVGGSSSHEDDEDATFFSALSGNNSGVRCSRHSIIYPF